MPPAVKPVVGRDGGDPAGFLRVATPGLLVIGYRSNPSPVELPADKFNQYLKEEGLDAVAGDAEPAATRPAPRRASSFRAARRAWCFPERRAEAQGDRALGFTLELVAERNPYAVRAGSGSSGSPDLREPSARGRAGRRHEPPEPRREALGAHRQGRPRAIQAAAGRHVADQGGPHGSGAGRRHAEWASFWASLTFELRNAGRWPRTCHVRRTDAVSLPGRAHFRGQSCIASSTRRLVNAALGAALVLFVCGAALRAHEIGTTRVSVLFDEGRTYHIEIVTDAAALVEKLDAVERPDAAGRPRSGPSSIGARRLRRDVSPAGEAGIRRVGGPPGDRVCRVAGNRRRAGPAGDDPVDRRDPSRRAVISPGPTPGRSRPTP